MQSAATRLTDHAQDWAQQLFNQKAASAWECGEWCNALRDELNQVDPVEEAGNGLYSMKLKSERYYPKFVASFNERLATLSAADPDDRMGQCDQLKCFRTALYPWRNEGHHNQLSRTLRDECRSSSILESMQETRIPQGSQSLIPSSQP